MDGTRIKNVQFKKTQLQPAVQNRTPNPSNPFPSNICLFKVNNSNIKKRCEIPSKLTEISERLQWRSSEVFIVNPEHISHIFLVFLLLTLKE